MNETSIIKELQEKFSDLINYEADDPLEKIDPITYCTPEGESCLHIAVIRGDMRAVELLIKAGLDINKSGDMGNTPLHYANKFGHRKIANLLIHYGASTNLKNDFGEIP